MRLGVNVVGVPPRAGGVEALYLRNVLAKLRDLRATTDLILYTDPDNHDSFEGWDRACVGTEHRSIEQAAAATNPEVVFSSLANAPLGVKTPLVLYAMELQTGDNGARRSWFASPVTALKRAALSASAVVVPSKFMQQECLRHLELPMDKVVVAPLGADSSVDPAGDSFAQKPFLLSVGDMHEVQTVMHIVDAIERIPEADAHILVLAGDEVEGEPRDWGPRVLRIDRMPESLLMALYQDCDAYIYPALRSTSGLGVIQAMRAGARVVAPRVGGIPEAAGNAALFFDPASMISLAGAIQRALTEGRHERAAAIKFGKQTAAAYTWENCAWKTLSALRRA